MSLPPPRRPAAQAADAAAAAGRASGLRSRWLSLVAPNINGAAASYDGDPIQLQEAVDLMGGGLINAVPIANEQKQSDPTNALYTGKTINYYQNVRELTLSRLQEVTDEDLRSKATHLREDTSEVANRLTD